MPRMPSSRNPPTAQYCAAVTAKCCADHDAERVDGLDPEVIGAAECVLAPLLVINLVAVEMGAEAVLRDQAAELLVGQFFHVGEPAQPHSHDVGALDEPPCVRRDDLAFRNYVGIEEHEQIAARLRAPRRCARDRHRMPASARGARPKLEMGNRPAP